MPKGGSQASHTANTKHHHHAQPKLRHGVEQHGQDRHRAIAGRARAARRTLPSQIPPAAATKSAKASSNRVLGKTFQNDRRHLLAPNIRRAQITLGHGYGIFPELRRQGLIQAYSARRFS